MGEGEFKKRFREQPYMEKPNRIVICTDINELFRLVDEARKDVKVIIIENAKKQFHTDNPEDFPSQSMGNWEQVYLDSYREWFLKWFGDSSEQSDKAVAPNPESH
jgi:hypothetical protein